MIRISIILLFLSAAFVADAQGVNPFEINGVSSEVEDTLASELIDDTGAVLDVNNKVASSNNPFDISYRRSREDNAVTKVATTKKLIVKTSNPGPSKGLVLIYTIISLILLSIAIALNRSRFAMILGSLVNGNNLKTLHRSNKPWSDGQSLILYGLFFLNGAFFLWLIGTRLLEGQLPNFVYLLLGLLALYIIRHLCMIVVSDVYTLGATVEQFNYSIALHNMVIGVLLLPFILSLGYVADQNVRMLAIALFVLIGIVYVLRQSKGVLSAIGIRGFNPFYFFIYLCAFELTPVLVAWKVIGGAL